MLRPLTLALALAFGQPAVFASIDMPPGVAWKAAAQDADIDAAFAQAKKENKPVLLYWGAKWCPPCNQLKATLFNRADFIEQSRAVVPVNIDGDLPGAQQLGTRFKVRGYPTLILFNPAGQELTRLPGEADAQQVVKLLQLGLSGGRPIQAVLKDAQAGKALKPAEWQLLSYYSWDTDQDQLVKASERGALLQKLSQAKGVPTEARVRLQLKALGAGAKALPGDAELLTSLLKDPKATRTHLDVISGYPSTLVKAVHPQASPARAQLLALYESTLQRQQADTQLSRADRVQALIARVQLARIDVPADETAPKLSPALLNEVRGLSQLLDREIRDGYERQAVITSTGYVLGLAGLWTESDALLTANLKKSHSPYYLMNQLGSNARKTGRNAEALNWYEQAFTTSQGPATRLQWGSTYFENLIKLAPQDSARIEKLAAQLISEAAQDKGAFYERSGRSLKKVSDLIVPWSKQGTGDNAAVLGRLQTQLNGVCAKVDAKAKAECSSLLRG